MGDATAEERLESRFETALVDASHEVMAGLVCLYRARAERAEGRCEGLIQGIAYFEERVATLEAREAEAFRLRSKHD